MDERNQFDAVTPSLDDMPKGAPSEALEHVSFPVVGIGASAGGLEALRQFLAGLPAKTGMAFVVVQHLDPHHESRLPELLGRAANIPVVEATHGLAVQPDHVYVITPNTKMALTDGQLHVSPRDDRRLMHQPIDFLFRSLAETQQSLAIAVVLSGTGSDGTQGVCEIKAVGGITFAQDERSAAHGDMPHSAYKSGCVDFVLSPAEIASRLAQLGDHPYLTEPTAEQPPDTEPSAERNYERILGTIRAVTGVDFSHYRDTTIKRRIMRRMALNTNDSFTRYAEQLRSDRKEVEALYQDLLINVTSFFREPEMFETLKTTVLPELFQDKASPNAALRIWTAGCSTGQEAYSLAMTVFEYLDTQPTRPPVQIFATDLDESGLEKARSGLYPEGIELELTPERLRRFFRKEDHVYRIDKSIRDVCVFARHNVTADPPFSHLDVISCRNVLIYLTTPLQKRVLSAFHYALNASGVLLLGSAETVGEQTDLFELKDRTFRIYSKKPTPGRHPIFHPSVDPRMGTAGTASRRFEVPGPGAQDYQREADRILLGRYAPPAVLVDENFEILLFRGRTSAFLEAPSGEPTTNVLKMAREGMFLDLRNALTEAKQHNRTTRRDGVSLRADGRVAMISIEVVPVRPNRGCNSYLILFSDEPPQASSVAAANPTVEATPVTAEDAATEVSQLRQELGATREYLQSLIEQQDAANEELRSANEEILSSNEELQSTNEELETAKEELQSANEELSTVNEQLQRRNVELDQVNNDLSNLLGSINIPVVMVSGDLRLRRFTPAARKVMGLLPTDIGRPITDIRPAHLIEDLEAVITEVIERVQPHEREVRDSDSLYFKLRVHPYRTADQKIDGAVLVLVDVDQLRRQQEEEKRQAAQPLQQAALIELSHDAVILRGADDSITSWNAGAQEIYGWTAGEAIGQSIDTLFQTHPDDLRELQAGLRVAGRWEGEMRQRRKDGTPAVVQSREVLVRDEMGESSAVLAITRDISELRAMMDALRKADRRKDEFLAVLAHELRNPLGPIRNAIEIMRLGAKDPDMVANARDVLDRQVRQMTGIIEDLIDLTRIVEGKIDLKMRTVALNSIVPTAVETCRSIIERYGHQLTVTIPTETYYVNVDAIRISQIIVNLLNNAAKYTDAGGKIWLDVSVEDAGEGGGDGPSHVGARNAAIHVRDTGRGIPAELLPSLFTIFTQGERCNEQVGGLGVGLALVRSLAQLHGGSVEARSAGAGQGSEFIVRLPLVDRPMEPQEPERLHVAPPVRPAAPSGTRILIVDDSTDQAESLGRLLTILGHSIRTTSTGEEGIEIIKQFRPHVALIDIGLPGINGYELARRIRETASVRDTVLVAQTGWGQEEDRRRSSEAGFDHHLVKPLEMADLTEILNTLERRD